MTYTVEIDGFPIEIEVLPDEKPAINTYYPGNRIKIITPVRLSLFKIKEIMSPRIEKMKNKREQARQRRKLYLQRLAMKPFPANIFVLGKLYKLEYIECKGKQKVEIEGDNINIYIRPNPSAEKKWRYLEQWQKGLLQDTAHNLIKKWEPILNVMVPELKIKKVQSYFGMAKKRETSNVYKYIILNLRLIAHSVECIELTVVHEMVHLIQTKFAHGEEFDSLMDKYLPDWRTLDKKQENEALLFRHFTAIA